MTTEAVIENATIEWLTDLGYIHIKGNELPQNATAVILKDQLLAFVQKQYPHLP
jgi:type I restriction enzyme R subunit